MLARRARMGRLARTAKRAGYGLWLVAIAGFVVAMATSFDPALTALVIGCLAAGSALLAPAIVIGYGVRAADREDRRG